MIDESGREVLIFNEPRGPYPGIIESNCVSTTIVLAAALVASVTPTVLALCYDIPVLFPR